MLVSLSCLICLVLMWIISKDKYRCRQKLFERHHKLSQMSWEDYERYIEYAAPCFRRVIFMNESDIYRFEDYENFKMVKGYYYMN